MSLHEPGHTGWTVIRPKESLLLYTLLVSCATKEQWPVPDLVQTIFAIVCRVSAGFIRRYKSYVDQNLENGFFTAHCQGSVKHLTRTFPHFHMAFCLPLSRFVLWIRPNICSIFGITQLLYKRLSCCLVDNVKGSHRRKSGPRFQDILRRSQLKRVTVNFTIYFIVVDVDDAEELLCGFIVKLHDY